MKRLIFVFLILAGFIMAQEMIVRVYASNWQALRQISPKYQLDIAAARAGQWYDIVADQEILNKIVDTGLPYEVIVHSLSYVKEQVKAAYLSYSEVNDSLRKLAHNFPSICKFDSLPVPTHGGNWLYGIKISDNPNIEEEDEAGFFVDGLHHSREWACPITVLFFADSMLRSYNVVPEITDIINTTEIYCFPIINADGYLYDYPSGHSWRKDREPIKYGTGIDPNRNYSCCAPSIEGDWGAVDENQASHYPSSDNQVYCGPYANAGDETMAYTLYVKNHICNISMSYHSYSEMVMWPWSWTGDSTPDASLYNTIGNRIADMIHKLGSGNYARGPVYSTIYPVSGASMDWFYSWCHWVGGFSNLSFTTELGTSFYQPQADLDNIIHENFKAFKYLAHFADSVVLLAEGVVPPPEIYSIGTVNSDFTIAWHAKNSFDNHPTKWELVELSSPSIIEDDLEGGTNRWVLNGFSLSTARAHSGSHSLFSGNTSNMNSAVVTAHPYIVQNGDSLTFWCWYDLEADYDVAVAEVSVNTKEWYQLDNSYTASSGGWVRKSYSLENWVGKSIYIRFRSMTDGNGLQNGFYVDDIYPVCRFQNVTTVSSNITDTTYQFTNHPEGEYYYYVKGCNTTWGWGDYSCLEKAKVVAGITEANKNDNKPQKPGIVIYPNPSSKNINISFTTGIDEQNADIKIYDSTGKLVRAFKHLTSRHNSKIVWNQKDRFNRPVTPGVYFIKFNAGNFQSVKKAILLR